MAAPVHPGLASAMLQKKEMAGFARKTSRKTTKGHFWQTFSSARRNAYGGGGGFLHRTGQGFLALVGAGGQVPHVARALVWFTRAISFTERTAFPATATLTRAGDVARMGSLWRNGFSSLSLRNKWQMHILAGGRFLLAKGTGKSPGCRCAVQPCFVQAHTGEQCSHRKTHDAWWLTAYPHYVACLLLGSLAEHPGTLNLTHGASPFLLPRVFTLVMLKPSETGLSLPFPNDWGTEETCLIRDGSMNTREEHDSG